MHLHIRLEIPAHPGAFEADIRTAAAETTAPLKATAASASDRAQLDDLRWLGPAEHVILRLGLGILPRLGYLLRHQPGKSAREVQVSQESERALGGITLRTCSF